MADAEWREWIKRVSVAQLRQSLALRQALLQHRYVAERRELGEEIEIIKAELKSRGK